MRIQRLTDSSTCIDEQFVEEQKNATTQKNQELGPFHPFGMEIISSDAQAVVTNNFTIKLIISFLNFEQYHGQMLQISSQILHRQLTAHPL